MEPRFETIGPKTLVGMHRTMSLAGDKTPELWRGFMPRRREIPNATSPDLFSMQIFPPSFDVAHIDLHASFEKWAAVEVTDPVPPPEGMESFALPGGLYAVFDYKGPASDGPKVFGYIFGEWLPRSGYTMDRRPQFEILGEKYKNDDPDSEEQIWIPVKPTA